MTLTSTQTTPSFPHPTSTGDNAINEASVENIISHTCDFQNKTEILPQALRHHFSAGGSRTRAKLCYNLCLALNLTPQQAAYMACVPELLHNASLIHDDLQDFDDSRRGAESLWKKFGQDIAICAGDFLISAAYKCAAESNAHTLPALIQTIHSHVTDVVKGQIDDLLQDKDHSLDNVPTYERICAKKSGALLAMCLTLPLTERGDINTLPAAKTLCEHYATAYQICDDLADIETDQAKKGRQAAVNIYTVLQQKNHAAPFDAATELALEHIKKAEELVPELPSSAHDILYRELRTLTERILNKRPS